MLDTNGSLQDRVTLAIDQNPRLAGLKVELVADHGRVVLHGKVRSYYEKQMAQEAIRHIQGVDLVDNQLEVGTT